MLLNPVQIFIHTVQILNYGHILYFLCLSEDIHKFKSKLFFSFNCNEIGFA